MKRENTTIKMRENIKERRNKLNGSPISSSIFLLLQPTFFLKESFVLECFHPKGLSFSLGNTFPFIWAFQGSLGSQKRPNSAFPMNKLTVGAQLIDRLALCQLLLTIFFLTFRGHNFVVRTPFYENLVLLESLESEEYVYHQREHFRCDSKDLINKVCQLVSF